MKNLMFKINIKDKQISDSAGTLSKLGITELIHDAYINGEQLSSFTFMTADERRVEVLFLKKDIKFEYYKLNFVIEKNTKKNKYKKIEMKKKSIEKIAKDIGFVNAQQIHAQDHYEYEYIPLRQFLKENKESFKKKYIYEKGYDDEYRILRHKNLFSKYQDEISDFEKLTVIEKIEPKVLKVSHEVDEDIFEFDDGQATIQERKFMREFAKDIYIKKNKYTERELFEILSGRDLYIQVVSITPKEHKDVWSKVQLTEMDIRLLKKKRSDYQKQNVPESKKRKYLSKKQKVRKKRRISDREKETALKEYYEHV